MEKNKKLSQQNIHNQLFQELIKLKNANLSSRSFKRYLSLQFLWDWIELADNPNNPNEPCGCKYRGCKYWSEAALQYLQSKNDYECLRVDHVIPREAWVDYIISKRTKELSQELFEKALIACVVTKKEHADLHKSQASPKINQQMSEEEIWIRYPNSISKIRLCNWKRKGNSWKLEKS